MTVQALIDALNKVEDKSLPVYYYDGFGDYGNIDEIETHEGEDGDVVLFEKFPQWSPEPPIDGTDTIFVEMKE